MLHRSLFKDALTVGGSAASHEPDAYYLPAPDTPLDGSDPGPQFAILPTSGTAANGKPIFSWDGAAAQIDRDSNGWAGLGHAAVVTYAFRADAPGTMPSDTTGFSRFTSAQISAAEQALQYWADVANITFVRVGSGTSGEGAYSNSATILFSNYSAGESGAAAFAFYPGSTAAGSSAGDVWVNSTLAENNSFNVGDYGAQVLAHEIGHAIGLAHPGDYNGGTPTYATDAIYWQDARMFTIMSYFGSTNTGGLLPYFSGTPQFHDIAAAQRLYGANTSTRTGDTIYGFHSNAGAAYTIASASNGIVFSVWDGGGNDTLDFSGYSQNGDIDLRQESFSSVGPTDSGPAIYNVSIARGVVIENAIGGSGNDTITGNDVTNHLTGNAGDDTMIGGLGNDVFDGGLGTDHASADYSDRTGDITFNLGAPSSTSFVFINNVAAGSLIGVELFDLTTGSGADVITGGALAEHFTTNAGNDWVFAGAGDDTIFGGSGVDVLQGQAGNDTISGDDTADYLYGGDGTDNLTGGTGNDNLFGDAGNDVLSGGDDTDIVQGDVGADTLHGDLGDDYLYGQDDNDMIFGDAGNDHEYGGNGDDQMYGGDGVDVLVGEGGSNVENGDAGDDYLYGGDFNDQMYGGDGVDVLVDNLGNDTLSGGAGDDAIYGGAGADSIDGGADNDYVFGGDGDDSITGGTGNDVLIGEGGVDGILGGDGSDYLYGGDLNDTLQGEAGDDHVFGDAGDDNLSGGDGSDTMLGDVGNDTMSGGNDNDFLYGEDGNDILNGDAGADSLNGGAGADTLNGGAGNDLLRGGADADTFVMQPGGGDDVIADFQDGVDIMDLRGYAGATFANTTITALSGGTLIVFAGGANFFLTGVDPSHITAADFLFS